MPEAVNDGDDSPDGEQYYDIYTPNRSNRYMDSLESKQKISGCMFGFIGTIVLGFGIFLIHKGTTSQRSEEVEDYLNYVHDWTTQYQS